MTGRGAGFCAGYGLPGYAAGGRGRGFGRGMGWGRGFGPGNALFAAPVAEAERRMLELRTKQLEEELKTLRGRLAAMGTDPDPVAEN